MSRRKLNLPYDRTAEGRRFTVAQVAERLNCSRSWVYRLVEDGRLKGLRIGNRKGIQITEKSLAEYAREAAF